MRNLACRNGIRSCLDIHTVRRYSLYMMKVKTTTAFDALNPSQRRGVDVRHTCEGQGHCRGSAADPGGRRHRQDQHAGASHGAPGAERRRSGAHSHADVHAPRGSGDDPPLAEDRCGGSCRSREIGRSQRDSRVWCGPAPFIPSAIASCAHSPSTSVSTPNFTVLDRSDAADFMDVIRHEFGFSGKEKRFPRKDTCLAIYTYRVNTRLVAQADPRGTISVGAASGKRI